MKNYRFIDKSCYLEKEKILVIADLHLGYEQGLEEQGVFLPKFQYKKTTEDLEKIFNIVGKVKEIIILGDLKHEFGTVSQQEWREVLDLLDFLQEKTKKIVLIKGNHDTILAPIAKKKNIELKEVYVKNDMAFIHGNKIFSEILDKKLKTLFLGHMHPAISISKGVKKEIYKCFLVGKFKDKEVVILPSFFPLVEGVDIVMEDTNFAFKLNLRNFGVFVPAKDEVLSFGKVRDAGKLVGS